MSRIKALATAILTIVSCSVLVGAPTAVPNRPYVNVEAQGTWTQIADPVAPHRVLSVRASRSRPLLPKVSSPSGPVTVAVPESKVTPTSTGSAQWARSSAARAVAECESGGNPRAVNATGKYRGKWQMDRDFWRSYGGLRFALLPDLALEGEQDEVAYRGWLARGWQPWECRKVL